MQRHQTPIHIQCSVCNTSKPSTDFSKNQFKRRKTNPKCLQCVTTANRSPIEVGIEFLRAKGVFATVPQTREIFFNFLINPSSILLPEERTKYEKIRERLIRLTSKTEETHQEKIPDDVHQFSLAEFPGYKKNDVFFLQYPESKVQRHQLSGLCYMHAPAVVQYYALNGTNRKEMIDLLKVVKDHFTAKELEHHIFDDMGGASAEFLRKILEPNSTTIGIGSLFEYVPSSFEKYGVGLVSAFGVYSDFRDTLRHHHYGKPQGTFEGHHAMALVGFRKDGNKLFFLLQNWWKLKQFVEVDEEYLKCCGATVHFIETPQKTIPVDFSTHTGHFFELEAIDKPEGITGEMKST
eukprot:TRINITY_DN7941_c0_g3_i1.p1 TRINITY_DN7941_c0_g3~~TRINITY_DN7941_c0_g3_i1.p1  ORF type:complete len:350 (-),score=59.93 TRINITY_DN7941_c0_g3_i1:34-1083(-)